MKSVSVIIPAYNEEERIEATLRALLAQEYAPKEIIVIDNASTDRTSEIAKSVPGITVLYEAQKGTNFALECGRKAATGEVIARLDADCLPDKDWVARGATHFDNPAVSGLTGPYDYFDADPIFRTTSLFTQKYIYSCTSWLFQLLHLGAIMTGGNSMMRAIDMQKVGGFDTSFTFYGDDTDTAKRLAKIGYVVFDKNLVLKTSARRFKKEGTIKIFWLYLFFFIKTTLHRHRNPTP